MSVFYVKFVKICWQLGAMPPDPLVFRHGEFHPQTSSCVSFSLSNPGCATEQKGTKTITGNPSN